MSKYTVGTTYKLPMGYCHRELLAVVEFNGTTRYQFNLLGGERKALVAYTEAQLDAANPTPAPTFQVYPAEVFRSLAVAHVIVPALVPDELVTGMIAAKQTVSLFDSSMLSERKIA